MTPKRANGHLNQVIHAPSSAPISSEATPAELKRIRGQDGGKRSEIEMEGSREKPQRLDGAPRQAGGRSSLIEAQATFRIAHRANRPRALLHHLDACSWPSGGGETAAETPGAPGCFCLTGQRWLHRVRLPAFEKSSPPSSDGSLG